MFIKKLLSLTVIVLFGLTPIACEQKGPAEKAGEKIDEAAEKVGEAIETSLSYTQEQMDAYQDRIDQKLKMFDQQLRELKSKTNSMSKDAKAQYIETIAALQQKKMVATAALKGLKRETGEAWSRMKQRLDEKVDDLEESFDRAAEPSS